MLFAVEVACLHRVPMPTSSHLSTPSAPPWRCSASTRMITLCWSLPTIPLPRRSIRVSLAALANSWARCCHIYITARKW